MHPANGMNLGRLLAQTARLHPDHPGLIHGERSWRWRDIDLRVQAMMAALRARGVSPGDKILVHSRNNLQMFESCWVAFRLGCVWVPTNFRLTPPEAAYLADSSHASWMIYEAGFEAHADAVRAQAHALRNVVCIGEGRAGEMSYEALVKTHLGAAAEDAVVGPDDALWYFYTSGTTGKPKAGTLTHGQMNFVVVNHLADLVPGITHEDCAI
ncbi:MAG: AMP-binding protein, partial [Burkholderiaceae bacterium]|nr:AMP-binding protein [Burkholderiaceae bacterium]